MVAIASDWMKFFKSSPLKLGTQYRVLYKISIFRTKWTTNMPSIGSFDQAVSEEKIQI
jgi:hypothetical protein